ncbi:hypothetical protein ACOME3_001169 [Neoechinorhynchus agilis]
MSATTEQIAVSTEQNLPYCSLDQIDKIDPVSLVRSEDVYGRKWDICLADTAFRTGVGFTVGAIASVLVFRRRLWPVLLSAGFGLGTGYTNCEHLFARAKKDAAIRKKIFAKQS